MAKKSKQDTIKAGIMLQVDSWENDADLRATKTLYGLGEAEAAFWIALAQLAGGEYSNDYESETLDTESLCEEFREMLDIHHSGFAVVLQTSKMKLNQFDLEDDKSLMELINVLAPNVLGSSECYSFRVYDGHRAYFIKEDIQPHVFAPFFKLES